MKLAMQSVIIQLVNPAPSQDDDVHGGQAMLLVTNGFTH